MAQPIIADDMFAVTPADGSNLPRTADSLYITGAGNIRFETSMGTELTIAVPANFNLICRVKKVWATNTTATGIYGYSKSGA